MLTLTFTLMTSLTLTFAPALAVTGKNLTEGDSCFRFTKCVDGLYCADVKGEKFYTKCKGEKVEGNTCSNFSECDMGMYCADAGGKRLTDAQEIRNSQGRQASKLFGKCTRCADIYTKAKCDDIKAKGWCSFPHLSIYCQATCERCTDYEVGDPNCMDRGLQNCKHTYDRRRCTGRPECRHRCACLAHRDAGRCRIASIAQACASTCNRCEDFDIGLSCPSGSYLHGEWCYRLYKQMKNMVDAYWTCRDKYDAKLVEVKTKQEDDAIQQMMYDENVSHVWLGFKRDDAAMKYTGWQAGFPKGWAGHRCVVKHAAPHVAGGWQDVRCASFNYFMCQKIAIP